MTTEIIILAQGTQKRLGMQYGWKPLIHLPGCRNVSILERTVHQVVSRGSALSAGHFQITVVTWPEVAATFPDLGFMGNVCRFVTLRSPGNSSLKGIARYLEESRALLRARNHDAEEYRPDATVVLLGDVIYSWAALDALFSLADRHGFVGTPDLSAGAGELWGVAWHRDHDDHMMCDLRDAMLLHPPFDDEYQPGQMRRWIMGWRRGELGDRLAKLARAGSYLATDPSDYVMDVDLPAHMDKIPDASRAAAIDDMVHGLDWPALRNT